jgi:aminopeptidase C
MEFDPYVTREFMILLFSLEKDTYTVATCSMKCYIFATLNKFYVNYISCRIKSHIFVMNVSLCNDR